MPCVAPYDLADLMKPAGGPPKAIGAAAGGTSARQRGRHHSGTVARDATAQASLEIDAEMVRMAHRFLRDEMGRRGVGKEASGCTAG